MSPKKILVTNNHLNTYGGSETFTYTLIKTLFEKGHDVEYFTFNKGLTSNKIEKELKVKFMSRKKYDVIFANHISCINFLRRKLSPFQIIIQTCHGIYPDIEQPTFLANFHISISEEVKQHINKLGYKSQVILNGIDTDRFTPHKPISKILQRVLSLCQSEQANADIQKACKQLKIEFLTLNKFNNPIWNVEKKINNVDLVIGLGRSAYEAMSCGRPVIVYDNRAYSTSYADGYINDKTLPNSLKNNCSGRFYQKKFTVMDLVAELQKYDSESGIFLREFALSELNIKKQVDEYLNAYAILNESFKISHLLYFLKTNILFYVSLPYYLLKIDSWFLRINFIKITKKQRMKFINQILYLKLDKEGVKNLIRHHYNLIKEK